MSGNGEGGVEGLTPVGAETLRRYQKYQARVAVLVAELCRIFPVGVSATFSVDLSGAAPKLVAADGRAVGRGNVEILHLSRPAVAIQQGFRVDPASLSAAE